MDHDLSLFLENMRGSNGETDDTPSAITTQHERDQPFWGAAPDIDGDVRSWKGARSPRVTPRARNCARRDRNNCKKYNAVPKTYDRQAGWETFCSGWKAAEESMARPGPSKPLETRTLGRRGGDISDDPGLPRSQAKARK